MTTQEGISIVQGLVNSKPLGGLTMLQAFQACANEIFAVDSYSRLREFGYFTTAAATLDYTFETMFGATSVRVRKVRGIYQPSLSNAATTDYGRQRLPSEVDQRIMRRRVYADETVVRINNEERSISFLSDPGTTTDKWKADYYLSAPTLSPLVVLPVLPGWEYPLFITGVQSYWEYARLKKAGPVRMEFIENLQKYTDALERDYDTHKHNSIEGYRAQAHVIPQ